MDEMDLISSKLDAIQDQIQAQGTLLASKIRYGDRQVEALVTLAADRHDRLQKDFDGLRTDFEAFKGHVESGELTAANKRLEWNRQTVVSIVGWLVAIAAIAAAFVK